MEKAGRRTRIRVYGVAERVASRRQPFRGARNPAAGGRSDRPLRCRTKSKNGLLPSCLVQGIRRADDRGRCAARCGFPARRAPARGNFRRTRLGRSRCAGDSRTNGYPFPVRLRIRRKPRLVCQVRSGTAFATSGAARGRSFGVRRFRLRSGRYRGGAEGRNAKRRRRRSRVRSTDLPSTICGG